MISVVIPTYNEEKNIEKALMQFENQTIGRENFELIVVDGDSKDKTREIAEKYADKVIIQKSDGVGGARNDGVEIAKNEFIATTDADTIIPNDWLENFVQNFKDENVIAVCGADGPIETNIKARSIFFVIRNFIKFSSYFGLYCLGGTNSAFRKIDFMKIGGYRDIPHSDDVDLGFRMKKIGKINYDKNIFVKFSTRRMEKNGYLKTLSTWVKGDTLLLLGKDIKTKEKYAKQEY
ncbi:MAG: glycosyltransferase [Candidatus Aenigmarchaeota archaeon]|nr:glycosyltransferase [Candidatus Aenigmarchaeota archaeon]